MGTEAEVHGRAQEVPHDLPQPLCISGMVTHQACLGQIVIVTTQCVNPGGEDSKGCFPNILVQVS